MVLFELILSTVTTFLFVFFFITSLKIEGYGNPLVGPGVFPAILSTIVVICSILWVIDSAVAYKKFRKAGKPQDNVPIGFGILKLSPEGKRLAIIIVLTVLYILVLMPLTGFIISTFLFLFASIMYFYRKWLPTLIVAFSMSLALYLLFHFVLRLPMPR